MGGRDRLHDTKALHDSRRNRRVYAPGDQPVGKSKPDHVEGIADGVRRTRASCGDHMARSAEIEIKRDFARNGAESRAGDVVGAHSTQLIAEVETVLLFDKVRGAAPAAEHHTPGALFFQARFLQADSGNVQRFFRRGDGQRDRAPHALQLPRREVFFRLEMLYLTGDPAGERFGIKKRNGVDATPSAACGLPKCAHTDTVGTDYAQPCYDNPAAERMTII